MTTATATKPKAKKIKTAFDSVHPEAECWPMLPPDKLAEMADNIKARGLDEAIVLQGRVLIDGRNRLRACEIAGVKPSFRQWKAAKKGDTVEAFIDARNDKRRHLDESQRALVAERKARLKAGLSPIGETPSGADNAGLTAARDEAAEKMGVGRRSVERAAVVVEHGSKALVAAVDAGTIPVSAAADIATLPKAEQTALVREGKAAVAEAAKEIRETKAEERAERKGSSKGKGAGKGKPKPESEPFSVGDAAAQKRWKGLVKSVSSFAAALEKAGVVIDGKVQQDAVDVMVRVGKPILGKRATTWTVGDMKAAAIGSAAIFEVTRVSYAGQRK